MKWKVIILIPFDSIALDVIVESDKISSIN